MNRHQMREAAFLLTFEKIFQEDASAEEIVEIAKECEVFPLDETAVALFQGVVDKQPELDAVIEPHLKNWKLNRISKVALAVLRLAVYEIKYCDDVDQDIAISEAVILTQGYAMKDDVNFVNGILGSIART